MALSDHENSGITLDLTRQDGNAMGIIGAAIKTARRAGWTRDETDALMNEMTSGDYDHLLQTAMRYFELEV